MRLRVSAIVLTMALGCLAVGASAATTAATPAPPGSDPFYSWSGPLAGVAPGTVLRRRTVSLVPAIAGVSTATQILYRTTDQLGGPTATVATIIRPSAPSGATKIVSYQTAYDALGAQCDPSYTLQGGNDAFDSDETIVMGQFVVAGDTVVVSDYEGPDLAYGAGQASGDETLDGIRATERALSAPASTPAAMIGYSGGSIATEFAAELAPRYAPRLHIAGVAAGGIPVDLAHNLAYVNGSKVWSSSIPGILVGVARAYGIDLDPYASAYGRQLFASVRSQCLSQYLGKYPGLRVAQLFQPAFGDYDRVPAFATLTNDLIMGRSGTPRAPMLMGVGNADGTGDGVMVARDVEGLAHEYCRRGVNVTFHEYVGADHTQAAPPFLLAAVPFLQARLGGQAVASGCASIGAGNALTPLPLPSYRLALGSVTAAGVRATLRSRGGAVVDAVVRVARGKRIVQTVRLARIDGSARPLTLNVRAAGQYAVSLSQAGVVLWSTQITSRVKDTTG